MRTMTISEARTHLPELVNEVNAGSKEAVGILRHGEPVATLISTKLYESIVETLEILSDPDLSNQLQEALRNKKKAKFIPLAKVKKELGIED